MESKIVVETANKVNEALVTLTNRLREDSRNYILNLGQILTEVKLNEVWSVLGYGSMAEYLAQPEIGVTMGNANHYMRVYESFVKRIGYTIEELSGIAFNRLLKLTPLVADLTKDETNPYLDKARTLSESDFILEVKNDKGVEKGQEKVTMFKMYRCKDCGKIVITEFKVEDLCQCGKNDAMIEQIVKQYGTDK